MARKSKKSSVVTPKGIACLAMKEAGIIASTSDPLVDTFWDKFVELLTRHGYSLPGIPAPTPVDLQDDNFGTMLNCAVRYALGRRTYMPSLVIGFITPLLPKLSSKTVWCFDQDVTDARYTGGYGDPCDTNDWLRFLAAVRAERTRRGEELYKSHFAEG
ncbi:MAG: hypothetical protein IJN44_11630 [Clostridia bacterium]|nr:hypothetical protein [Clostridia bacterium]